MKRKLNSMWRVTIALVLLLSLSLVTAVPVSAAVSQPEVTLNKYAPAANDAIYTIAFTTNEELVTGDTITIEFPEDGGTDISAIVDAADVTVGGANQDSVIVGQRLSITLGNDLPIGDITVVVGAVHTVTNPADGDYTLDVYTREEPTAVTSAEYTISTTVTGVTEKTDAPAPQTVSTAATYDIDFTTTVELRSDDFIVIEFPVDTDISNVDADDVTVTDNVAGDVAVKSANPVGQVLTITLDGTLVAGATEVTIANIINPTTVDNPNPLEGDTTEWRLTVYTTFATGTGGDRIPAKSDAYTLSAETAIFQVAWSTVDEYVPNDTDADQVGSTEFVIETQDQYGNPVAVTGDTTFTLTASSGDFYGEAACTSVITSIQIDDGVSDSGASANTLYYKGDYNAATDGTVTITADETVSQGWDIASTTILVNPQLELWGGGERKAYYNTFTDAIAAALPDDTIKVAPSTYDGGFIINKPYLTIESTAGAATTIIEGSITLNAGATNFVLGGAEGKGFTLQGGVTALITLYDPTGVEISYNTLDTGNDVEASDAIRMWGTAAAGTSDLLVTENTFIVTDLYDMGVRGHIQDKVDGLTVTNNTFTGVGSTLDHVAIEINHLDISTEDSTISGNIITTIGSGVIIGDWTDVFGLVCGTTPATDGTLVISGNTFDDCNYGIDLVNTTATGTNQNVVITQNTFSDNNYGFAIDYGTLTVDTDNWEPVDFTVDYNDFSGNTYAVYNNKTGLVAENNYWGSVTGPTITANVGGIGDRVSTEVDYDPWLNASGGTPIKSCAITLVAGWNLISLPFIPTDSSIDTVLAGAGTDVTVNKVAYYTGGPAGSWLNYSPSAPSDLDTMNDGKGYWIDASAGTLTATGVELAQHGLAPPTYDVVVGWNLIGVTSIGTPNAGDYLGSVMDTVEAMYLYNASSGAYTAVLTDDSLVTGAGYWLAVNAAGKIYP